MSTKQKEDPHQTSRDLIKNNTRTPKSIIEQYNELEGQLEKLGIDIKPRYTLPPIFGGFPFTKGQNQNQSAQLPNGTVDRASTV